MAVLAGVDFFTVEVLTWHGLKTYYVLFFLHLETRRVTLAGIPQHPTELSNATLNATGSAKLLALPRSWCRLKHKKARKSFISAR